MKLPKQLVTLRSTIRKLGSAHYERGGIHEKKGWFFCKCRLAQTIRKLNVKVGA